jgi:Leucine-rich repeat (LRR) protein
MKKDIIKYLEKKDKNIKELKLVGYNLMEIPNLSKFTNLETLNLSNNKIKFLLNIPSTVKTLIIKNNKIEKILYISENLKILNISRNLLTELDLINTNIEELICIENKISSISYPYLLKKLNISHNKLKNLHGLPSTLIMLDCSFNKIKYIDSLPNSLEYFEISCNKLSIIDKNNLSDSLKTLNISHNKIIDICCLFPLSLTELNCSFNKIKTLSLPNNLLCLFANNNDIDTIFINNLIEEIDLSHNNLSEVPYLPNTLLSFDCSFNHKIEIIYLSENIIELNCNHCNVKEIEINDVIEVLLCDYNPISNLGYLPNCLEKISCKYTKIKKLENIPNNLEYLNIEGCEFCDEDIKYFDIFVDLCSFNC